MPKSQPLLFSRRLGLKILVLSQMSSHESLFPYSTLNTQHFQEGLFPERGGMNLCSRNVIDYLESSPS